jgi:hypothetical protein
VLKRYLTQTLKIGRFTCHYRHIDQLMKAGRTLCKNCEGFGDVDPHLHYDWMLKRSYETFSNCPSCDGTGLGDDDPFHAWIGKRRAKHG